VTAPIHTDGGRVVAADLPFGSAAFFDREWAPLDRATAIPAVVVTGTAEDRVQAGARALAAIAEAALAAVADVDGAVDVTGAGLVAAVVRRRLDSEDRLASRGASTPAAVIETTGDPSDLVAALRRVSDAGTVVLVGEPVGRTYDVDLYPDVHVRGLRLIGRGPQAPVAGPVVTDGLQSVTLGQPLDAAMLWHCVARRDEA
jgi:threonine dehydrogenase-like Zn-dependent dehydrogenase